MIDALPLLLGPEGYQISRSVRLRSSASAYLNRTFGTPTNQKIGTFSFWVKRGSLGARRTLVSNDTGTNYGYWEFDASDRLNFGDFFAGNWTSTSVYRDPSAWYHIVIALDSTAAVNADRIKVYINNRQDTTGSATITQNSNWYLLQNASAQLGAFTRISTYFDGYLTEINFIDGQALTPSSFGETNPVTGVWQPKKYTGTYGTNGFYLNFSDNSAATAAAIGKDYSGNGNNWTPNNISVTSGATYDSMLDVPTQWADGGNGRGNYAVINPVAGFASMTVSDGNLKATPTLNTGWHSKSGTMAVSSGKWYAEFSMPSITSGSQGNPLGVGIVPSNREFTAIGQMVGDSGRGYGFYCPDTAGNAPLKRVAGSNTTVGTGTATATTDVFMVAFDLTNGNAWFGKNGTWYAGDPSAGTGASITGIVAGEYVFGVSVYRDNTFTNNTVAINFGQRPFAYTPPSGFKALNTLNLPTPTILKGNQYFDATLYTGNGSSLSVTNSGAMQPDLVWTKARSTTYNNSLVDAVRGVSKSLQSNLTNAEDNAPGSYVTAFNSDGFTVGTGIASNANGTTYVGWQWKEGATQGFDIVTYTGTGVARTVAHNLGVAPAMMIIKTRSLANGWPVYHASLGNTGCLYLNNTTSFASNVSSLYFNNTSPTSTVFTVGSYTDVNNNAATYVAYLFAEVAGFSRFGSYTGNGSADGPFVFCGFRPAFVLVKESSAAGNNWVIYDTARDTYNECSRILYPNLSNAEFSGSTVNLDILSNGFKARDNWGGNNNSGSTYIFAAFAEFPFKNALAR